ncbi:ATP-binding cassette domain-containing protein [Geodermatophilus sp. CPCC 206100]|uniref:branched-chain amino acid ABC transporter ATP-binding protein/permease n=1 Tax=Geodermatophilus sp. CPCC 206100 TaxID=3020054 RepID=UPI003B00B7F6
MTATVTGAPARGRPARPRGPAVRRWSAPVAVVAVGALAAAPFGLAPFALGILTLALVYGLFTYGLDLAWGRVGLVSVGQAAFFGAGAYAVVIGTDAGMSLPVAGLLGVLAGAALAALVAAIALSVPEATSVPLLILLTLGVSQLLQRTATSLPDVTGGANGGLAPVLGLVEGYYVVLAACVVAVALTAGLLVEGRRGLFQLTSLSNPLRAEHLGVDLRRTRWVAFVAAGAVSALAGVLFAPVSGIVTPASLGLALSASVLVWLAVGGKGSIAGPFLGAGLLTIGTQTLGGTLQNWYVLGTAALFVVVVQVAPQGLAGALRRLVGRGRDVPALPGRIRPLAPHPAPAVAGGRVLEVRDVEVDFGGTPVLQGASLTVDPGEVVCLIGPNGAGKSTLLGAVAGSVEVARGRVLVQGVDVTAEPTHRRVRRGMARMFQVPRVFDDLTVADNRRAAAVMAGVEPDAGGDDAGEQRVAGELSMADRRHLELDMVLTGSPELLLLDEPAAGLSHDETGALAARIRAVAADRRCGIVVVEHDMELVRQLADRVVVLSRGVVIADGSMDEIVAHDTVRTAYLGAS